MVYTSTFSSIATKVHFHKKLWSGSKVVEKEEMSTTYWCKALEPIDAAFGPIILGICTRLVLIP